MLLPPDRSCSSACSVPRSFPWPNHQKAQTVFCAPSPFLSFHFALCQRTSRLAPDFARRVPRCRCAHLRAVPSALFNKLNVQGDCHCVAHEQAAGFQSCVPGEAKIFPADPHRGRKLGRFVTASLTDLISNESREMLSPEAILIDFQRLNLRFQRGPRDAQLGRSPLGSEYPPATFF